MGVYIYRLETKLRKHPIYGEVGVLKYWDRLAWASFGEVREQEKRIALQNKKWAHNKPRFVVFVGNKNTVYDFSDYPYAVYYDTESLPLATPPTPTS